MSQTPPFCRFPGDAEGWRRALVSVWRADSWAEHCVLEGLKVDCAQCETLLLEGLKQSAASAPASGGEKVSGTLRGDALRAHEEALMRGYHTGSRAAPRIFYLAYHKFVRYATHRMRITSVTQPGEDDVVQDLFFGLHEFLKRGGSVRAGCLRGYVWQSAVNACKRALAKERTRASVPLVEERVLAAAADITSLDWVDLWEDLDRQLCTSKPGDLINRVILAHMCLEARFTGKKGSVEELLGDWRRLAEVAEDELPTLHEQVAARVRREPQQGPVRLAAEMIESGAAEQAQVALILAAATGLTLDETREKLDHLKGLSANAVSVRRSRMYDAMVPRQDK